MAVFEYKNAQIELITFGNGSIPVLAFHGFGLNAEAFHVFEPALAPSFKVYSFSILHHGNTHFEQEKNTKFVLQPEELKEFITAFCRAHQIDQFVLLAYSIGGKIALKAIELMPERIKAAFLIAPDGLKRNFWYYFATQHSIGKILFHFFIQFPHPFIFFVDTMSFLGVLPKNMKKFLLSNFREKKNREKVKNVWITFSGMDPKMNNVLENIEQHQISTHILMGTYDPVLQSSSLQKVIANKQDHISWYNVEGGHNLLKISLLPTIEQIIQRMLEKIK